LKCDPEDIGMIPSEGVELFRPFLFLEPGRMLAVKEEDMKEFLFGENMPRIGTKFYDSPMFTKKL
jgi:hypothetical protein